MPFSDFDQVLHAARAEGVSRVHDRPFLLAERFDSVVRDHARRIGIVGTEPKIPGIAHMG